MALALSVMHGFARFARYSEGPVLVLVYEGLVRFCPFCPLCQSLANATVGCADTGLRGACSLLSLLSLRLNLVDTSDDLATRQMPQYVVLVRRFTPVSAFQPLMLPRSFR